LPQYKTNIEKLPIPLVKSSVLEDLNFEEEYSAHEYSGSFSVTTPNNHDREVIINDDTDIEADDGFKEYSKVTFEANEDRQEKEGNTKPQAREKRRKSALVSSRSPACLQTSRCSTQCAGTYRNRRNRRKLSTWDPTKNLTSDDSDDNSTSSTAGRRKLSNFQVNKSGEKNLIEGTFKKIESINFENYLTAVGAGQFTKDMVMRAGVVLRITKELDKQWRISTETLIRGKSVRGYRTNNRKMTENKFKVGEEKPELLDDWDQRLVVSILEVNNEKTKLTLQQTAEKDQSFANDSLVEFEVEPEEPNVLVVKSRIGDVVAWRKFERQINSSRFTERKTSSPF